METLSATTRGIISYRFFVTEAPDLTPPTIDIQITALGTGSGA